MRDDVRKGDKDKRADSWGGEEANSLRCHVSDRREREGEREANAECVEAPKLCGYGGRGNRCCCQRPTSSKVGEPWQFLSNLHNNNYVKVESAKINTPNLCTKGKEKVAPVAKYQRAFESVNLMLITDVHDAA